MRLRPNQQGIFNSRYPTVVIAASTRWIAEASGVPVSHKNVARVNDGKPVLNKAVLQVD